MRRFLAGVVALFLAATLTSAVLAQSGASVRQSGTITPNTVPYWVTNGVIGGGVTAADSPLTTFGVTGTSSAELCANSARVASGAWQSICMGYVSGIPTISVQANGAASPMGLQFLINGTPLSFPTGGGTFITGSGAFTVGDVPCFLNTSGAVQDCGLALANGTVTSGTWQGTAVALGFGGTGANSAVGARANLGLGSIATQNANAVSLTGGAITGMPTPVNPTDVAIKSYVDATSSGLNILAPSVLATATVLPNSPTYSNGSSGVGATLTAGSNTTLTVDGTVATINTVVLVKNQASASQNGIYTVTTAGSGSAAWVLTRATYFNTAAQMKVGSYTFITSGSTNVNSAWTLQSTVVTIGTDAITFVQFSSGNAGTVTSATIAAGTGISVSGTCTITSSGTCTVANTGVTSVTAGAGLFGGAITTTGTVDVDPSQQHFGGRLTLISGTPEINADTVGAQTVYYAPDGEGSSVPILVNGGNLKPFIFTSSLTDTVGLSISLGGSANWAAGTIHDVFAILQGGVPVLATRAWDSSMLPASPSQVSNNVTITSGTSGASSWSNPGNAFNGTVNQSSANSAVISPSNNSGANCIGQDFGSAFTISQMVLTAPTDNQIRGDGTTTLPINTFGSNDNTNWTIIDQRNINSSANNTQYTIGINTSMTVAYRYVRLCITGNGANAIRVSQLQFYTTAGPSTRRLTKYGGILVNDASITARINSSTTVTVPQYQATFLGTIQIDAGSNGQVSAYVTPGPSRVYNIWNAHNQRNITLRAVVPFTVSGVGPNNYNLTSTSFGYVQSTSTFSLTALIGYAYESLNVTMMRGAYMSTTSGGAGYAAGIGVDSNNNISGSEISITTDSTGQNQGFQGTAYLTVQPFYGTHTFYGVEYLAYSTSGTLSIFTNILNTNLTASWRG